MELNAEKIIKSLECCVTPKASDCKECSYRDHNDGYSGCTNGLIGDALALIKELTDKVGELECKCEELRADAISWQATVEEIAEGDKTLFDVIDALHRKNRAYDKVNLKAFDLEQANKELTKKNERLRAEGENQSTLWKQHFESIYETAKETVKADTVREMAERLKARKVSYGNITFKVVPIDDIDQVAREMEDEQNDISTKT